MPGVARVESIHTSEKAKTVTTSIKFKTSGTLLRNLFPSKSYSFASTDTVVMASFIVQSRHNVELLGNHGFERVALVIHGVKYTKSDGSVVTANFVPVVFENSADVITASREELGYPSVFSDIKLETPADGAVSASLSWRGVQWAKLSVTNLAASSVPKPDPEDILVHRSLSKIADETSAGEFDIEQDILLVEKPTTVGERENALATINGNATPSEPHGVQESNQASIGFTPHSQGDLPTLHHIVSRLAELPVFSIVSATKWEELCSATRLSASTVG